MDMNSLMADFGGNASRGRKESPEAIARRASVAKAFAKPITKGTAKVVPFKVSDFNVKVSTLAADVRTFVKDNATWKGSTIKVSADKSHVVVVKDSAKK